MKNNVLYA